jgi:carbon-monoxide dehydrogenase medium subunit
MKSPPFRYHDPDSVAEAVSLLARCDNAKLLAGGQSLMPMLNMRFVLPDDVVDLGRITALSGVREEPGALVVGAMTTQRMLEFSPVVQARLPLIGAALRWVGHRQTRNRGTLGGSLCHLDPAAEMVTVAAALDAVLTVEGPAGARRMDFAAFPLGFMMPSLAPDEVLTEIRFPLWSPTHRFGFSEFVRRHGDYAIAAAAVMLEVDAAGIVTRAALSIGGLAAAPIRVAAAEQALIGSTGGAEVIAQVASICGKLEAMGDALVPEFYRRHLAGVMARRALQQAMRGA